MARILVVEDEGKVLRSLERGLQAEGYDVVAAATGEEGYQQATAQAFDCMVLDLLLPGRDGLQVLADLRQTGSKVPVLILTARDAVEDRVIGPLYEQLDRRLLDAVRQAEQDPRMSTEPDQRLRYWIEEWKEHEKLSAVVYDAGGIGMDCVPDDGVF